MEKRFEQIEIIITDFVKDSVDEGAFAVNFQVNGPGSAVEYLRVSFSDEFIEDYFHITWKQDLAEEEDRLEREKKDLFILWAVARIEDWLKRGLKEKNIIIESTKESLAWAKALEEGRHVLRSVYKGKQVWVYIVNMKE